MTRGNTVVEGENAVIHLQEAGEGRKSIQKIEALKAHDQLKTEGISIRVIDAYSVQPIDAKTMIEAGNATGGALITVEDHSPSGGIGDAVSEAVASAGFAVRRLAVREVPRSGQPDELLDKYGISARSIVDAVRQLVASPARQGATRS